ncbi:hypothetical protein CAP36_03940 [Chitinophagaceae bacterium IBVUCB2]|nr:hypothetical protein CAP36_03940 [Chitinophagaceae bacterium IBVUCB2]
MNHPKLNIFWRMLSRKLTVILLLAVSAFAAYATLGDGKSKASATPKKSLLSNKATVVPGSFSLKSGYTYRGNQVIKTNSENKYISLNTVVTTQRGNTVYIVPLKKKVILNNVKIDIGNRQLKRN